MREFTRNCRKYGTTQHLLSLSLLEPRKSLHFHIALFRVILIYHILYSGIFLQFLSAPINYLRDLTEGTALQLTPCTIKAIFPLTLFLLTLCLPTHTCPHTPQELLSCKRNIGEVMEASTQAYDSRDDAQTKLLSLKEKADKEVAQYEMEVKVYTYVCSNLL